MPRDLPFVRLNRRRYADGYVRPGRRRRGVDGQRVRRSRRTWVRVTRAIRPMPPGEADALESYAAVAGL
jgi:hypothetical protein